MRQWSIGDVTVSQVVEHLLPNELSSLIPAATPEEVLAIDWIYPEFVTDKGELSFSVHALIIETPSARILVDTCIGNDKDLPIRPFWNKMQTSFLDKLIAAGFHPDTIDYVVCTHLHLDHVGWNTTLVKGTWEPTFKNARYLFGRTEYEHLCSEIGDDVPETEWVECVRSVYAESLAPVLEKGLADFVEFDHEISEEVRLVPSLGHTPGHVSVLITSNDESALITGDAVHHPCQLAHPTWCATADVDPMQAVATRHEMFEAAVTKRHLLLGTHWTGVGGGYLQRFGEGYRLIFEPTKA